MSGESVGIGAALLAITGAFVLVVGVVIAADVGTDLMLGLPDFKRKSRVAAGIFLFFIGLWMYFTGYANG